MKHGGIVGCLMGRVRLALVALLFLLPSMGAFAVTPVTLDTGIFFDAAGTMWYKTVGGQNTLMYPDLQISKTLPVQTVSHGTANVPVVRQPRIDLTRVGASVVGMAKLLGPIGVGITVAQLICSQSTICDNGAGSWSKAADAGVAGYPLTTPDTYGWTSSGWNSSVTGQAMAIRAPSPQVSCDNLVRVMNSDPYWTTSRTYGPITGSVTSSTATTMFCGVIFHTNPTPSPVSNYAAQASLGACPVGYTANPQGGCTLNGNPSAHAPSDAEWTTAKTALSTQNMIQPLLDKSQPVPVYAPPVVPPVTQTIGTTSTTNPDGTRTDTTTSLTTTDTSTSSAPNSYTVSETTVTNIYNTSNVLINTTTTTADPPAPVVALSNTDTSLLARETTLQDVRNALTNPTMPDITVVAGGGSALLDGAGNVISGMFGGLAGANKQTVLGLDFPFAPGMPSTATCTTIPFGARTWVENYDMCVPLGKARDMWGWLISMLAALYIFRRGAGALSVQPA